MSLDGLLNLQNKYTGKRGFIVATGPSLAYKNMSFLKNEITITMNLGPLMFDQWGFQPTFHLAADKYVYPQFKEVFQNLTKDTPTTKIVIASACETFPDELKDDNTFFSPIKHPQEIINFSKDPIRNGFWRGKTVAYDALQFAYFLGLSEVHILGMDMTVNHDWGSNSHCYELQKNSNFPNIDFPRTDSTYIQRGLPGHPEYLDLIKNYFIEAQKIFNENGRKIINDSRSSLTVLPQEDILRKFSHIPNIVAFIPAKGTSSRVLNKNTRMLGEKPLFLHVLDTALASNTIDSVYLDTESDELANLAEDRTHYRINRPVNLANNATDGNKLMLFEASQVPNADIYVQILPTAPFLQKETIDRAIYELIKNPNQQSLIAVLKQKQYLWSENGKPINYNPFMIPNSVDLAPTINETMGLYVIRKNELLETKTRVGNKPKLFEIPLLDSFDINTEEEFSIAQAIFKGRI
jgi:CMP-N-acetylneuraminic acid synthetase